MEDTDELLDATTALVPPLLTGLDVLSHAGRHMHPPNIPHLAAQIEPYRGPVKEGIAAFEAVQWPEHLQGFAAHVDKAASLIMRAFDEFLSAQNQSNPTMAAYRAMGYSTKATEAVYPLAAMLPPVSRFFLNPQQREDETARGRHIRVDENQRNRVGIIDAGHLQL